ncbi:rna polymerase ii-associated protein 3 [Moniliophthora roreri MCA 2997]|uniref:Rna polymerase ii-associated protein 3 n=1 Tax=Moniliophthora roreri (strain MCA 2997) TaxID=1381753 RepID=V2WKU9_MONRO|nr:rna polymerase ii-associated protein 3 [Moniliophthora roreri MCA 2997]
MAPSEKAQIAKEKGNAAFKSGDYPIAIGHHSAAIIEDGNDPTFPLNRAAAYLKLGKNEDAERDCTTVLTLNPSSMSISWNARKITLLSFDVVNFEAATKIEPGNQAVKDELGRIQVLAQKASKTTAQSFGSSAALDPRIRCVPIQTIETSQGTPSVPQRTTTSAVRESSPPPALSTTSTTTDPPTVNVATPPKTFQDVKCAREETRPSTRIGGGIFRALGKNTLFNSKESSMTSSPPAPSINVKTFANFLGFTKVWRSLERFQLIKTVEPSTYPTLESSLLISIVQTFLDILTSDSHSDAKRLVPHSVAGFLHIPGISTIALFLSGTEKDIVKRVLEKVDDASLMDLWRSLMSFCITIHQSPAAPYDDDEQNP